ncbi:hypothetical protein, partial [Candidatus Avelusimicrobium faecicola]|uniref:hypothetical protein n=1 Tax=Candidatus Avelusimicrobium faecicola TaxID=3416205 RepID=UPI003D12D1DD
GQVKCLYNSVKNKFYKRLQRGALNGKRRTTTATTKNKRKKHKKSQKYTLFNRLARRKNIKISKNRSKLKGRGKSFLGKIILKIWGLCLPLFNRGCFVFFF